MSINLDIAHRTFNKHGEELCGDTVRVRQTEDRTVVVLSDGLGSGVKASILSTLTAQILVTMLSRDADLDAVIETVIGTLPICQVRELAYATFSVVEVQHSTGRYRMVNFDNPPPLTFRGSRPAPAATEQRQVLGRKIQMLTGQLQRGDFLAMLSDGTIHAGLGLTLNFGWGWDSVHQFVQNALMTNARSATDVVTQVMDKTWSLYGQKPGDDASFVGIWVRDQRRLMVFTGPPLTRAQDPGVVDRLMKFDGRKTVCGGTTSILVARCLGTEPRVDIDSMTADCPPTATIPGIDLCTEGIITMNIALDQIRRAHGRPEAIPRTPDGGTQLAREILAADDIHFLVGQKINEFYQNPDLPLNLSLRKSLIQQYAELLQSFGRRVTIEYL